MAMHFRQQQDDARRATRVLLLLFLLTVALTLVCTNAALALIWRLQVGGLFGYPNWFFETNTLVALGFILGGSWVETLRLRGGGAHLAELMGGRELTRPRGLAQQRLRNVVDEMAIASGLKSPRIFVLEREHAINAFAAGWEQHNSVLAVTRGALERLTRDELQGVVAHEFGHILGGDTRLNMRLIGYVFGLQMIFNFGRSMTRPSDDRGRRSAAALMGVALMAAGSIGWLAGRLLKAAVARQREFLADAYAVEFTRLPDGIGGALRKIAWQARDADARMRSANTEVVLHLLLAAGDSSRHRWLATHPPLTQRLQRIFGHPVTALAADVIEVADDFAPADDLPPLEFEPPSGGAATAAVAASIVAAAMAGAGRSAPGEAGFSADAVALAERSLARLRDFAPPGLLRATVLSFLLPAQGQLERQVWDAAVTGVPDAPSLRSAVARLPGRRRQPWFERLLEQAATLPTSEQRRLREQALQIVGADARLLLHELLAALLLHQSLSPRRANRALEWRHLQLAQLGAEVAVVTSALASLLPLDAAPAWLRKVLDGLALAQPPADVGTPGPASVRRAITQLRRLSLAQSPQLAKQWVASQPTRPMGEPMADALRVLCLLLDTPMPPGLAAMFDPLDRPHER